MWVYVAASFVFAVPMAADDVPSPPAPSLQDEIDRLERGRHGRCMRNAARGGCLKKQFMKMCPVSCQIGVSPPPPYSTPPPTPNDTSSQPLFKVSQPTFKGSLPREAQRHGGPCYYDRWRVAHCVRPKKHAKEHIVFMGDSLTRYQYVALAAAFRDNAETGPEFPSIVKEREWRHWTPYYIGSTKRLGPHTRCDCHRTFAVPVGSKTIENRYFWTEDGKLNLTFIQVLNPTAILGTWPPLQSSSAASAVDNSNQHQSSRGGGGGDVSNSTISTANSWSDSLDDVHTRGDFAPRWRLDWATCIREVVAKLQPPPVCAHACTHTQRGHKPPQPPASI